MGEWIEFQNEYVLCSAIQTRTESVSYGKG